MPNQGHKREQALAGKISFFLEKLFTGLILIYNLVKAEVSR